MNSSKKLSKVAKCFVSTAKKNFSQENKLFIYDQGMKNSISGIRATIFGATGYTGQYIGEQLGTIGSEVLYPFRPTHKRAAWYSFDLKLTGDLGYSHLVPYFDFSQDQNLDNVIDGSNVVINLIGTNEGWVDTPRHDEANIKLAKRIAKSAKENGAVRFIHFSAAGADPQSPSRYLRTKWLGEQEVLDVFPEATIIRPCTIFTGKMEDKLFKQHSYSDYLWLIDEGTAKRQPIQVHDVAKCVLNALKMPETCGKTYELGGPHVYTLFEMYEMILAKNKILPNIVSIPYWFMHNALLGMINGDNYNLEHCVHEKTDLVVQEGALGCEDLYVRPVSWAQVIESNWKWLRPLHYGPQSIQDDPK